MCYAILKVRYRSATERNAFTEVELERDLESKIEELKARPEVASVTVFKGVETHSLVQEWRTVAHE